MMTSQQQQTRRPATRSRDGSATTAIGRRASLGRAAAASSGEVFGCTRSPPVAPRSRISTFDPTTTMTSRCFPCRVAVTSSREIPRVFPAADADNDDDGQRASLQNQHSLE